MSLVLLVLLSMATLIRIESVTAKSSLDQLKAKQAALLSLNVALGELQKNLGKDQRVTAPADILSDNSNLYSGGLNVPQGQKSWLGIWSSDAYPDGSGTYNVSTPDQRTFLAWLVSGTDAAGNYKLPDTLNQVENNLSALQTSEHVALYKADNQGNEYALAEKITIDDSNNDTAFAFQVVGEASKADLAWSEIPENSTTSDIYQNSRLAALPGPDYSKLNGANNDGPFNQITYPLTTSSSQTLQSLPKINDLNNLSALPSGLSSTGEWLSDNRSNVTWGSRGLLTDVKWGGLRRDLSLAFEMDGEAEAPNATLFNQQTGEFVSNGDRLSSSANYPGMPTGARYLHRDFKSSNTIFSSMINRDDAALRGPTWWAMRDYANLYKRLKTENGSYTLPARSKYPNRSTGNTYYDILQKNHNLQTYKVWDTETVVTDFMYYPVQANYAPVYLGMVSLMSALPYNDNLALGIDNLFYIWNPYQTQISFESLTLIFPSHSYPGWVRFWIKQADGTLIDPGVARIRDFFGQNVGGNDTVRYLLTGSGGSSVTMEPGEVMVFSPEVHDQIATREMRATPGFTLNNQSGFILEDYYGQEEVQVKDSNGDPVRDDEGNEVYKAYREPLPFDPTNDLVGFNYIRPAGGGGERLALQFNLGDANTSLADLNQESSYGEELQYRQYNLGSSNKPQSGFSIYSTETARDADSPVTGESDGQLNFVSLFGKRYFGMFAVLQKPSAFGAQDTTPLEVFSMFNPRNSVFATDQWYSCAHNELVLAISSADSNDLVNNNGINIPISKENGFWGASYQANAASSVPMLNIPNSPLFSLAQFADANISIKTADPMRIVGHSRANPYIDSASIFGDLQPFTGNNSTTKDAAWLANDALFDRYYLSGIAPSFSISSSGYRQTGSLRATLNEFYDNDNDNGQANPILLPYIPDDLNSTDVLTDLDASNGYRKVGAYSMINGAFNVNSTSVDAWKSFLGSNRDITVNYLNGGSNSDSGVPLPITTTPVSESISKEKWSGFPRLNDNEIDQLAQEIVNQVKLRGPFMSLSDFINRRVGTPKRESTHYAGALQAAIDAANVNSSINGGKSGGVTPVYPSEAFPDMPSLGSRDTASGIASDISQINLLLPLAPRLTARSDTFRIRAYGEMSSNTAEGETPIRMVCEAVVQRLPEYTDKQSNDPWDEATDPLSPQQSQLAAINEMFGRKFKVVHFRWLTEDEI